MSRRWLFPVLSRRWLVPVVWRRWLVLAGLIAFGAVAHARPGGGQSSSGGSRTSGGGGGGSYRSSSSSSGGGYKSSSSSSSKSSSTPPSSSSSSSSGTYSGSGTADTIALVAVGGSFGIFGVIVAANVLANRRTKQKADFPRSKKKRIDLRPLLKRDPDFSRAVFEDFVFELYAAAQRERGSVNERLAPYFSPEAAAALAKRGPAPQQVVVGTLSLHKVRFAQEEGVYQLVVHIEATLIGDKNTYVVERWTFSRGRDVTSRPPARTRTWPCPNCGAPWQASSDRTCAHCGELVAAGRFDWMVASIQVLAQTKALASLRGTVPEQGNDLPTVEDLEAPNTLRQLTATDPHVTWESLTARIRMIYGQLNTAWNERDLGKVRGLVTASLRNYLDYWLREYKKQGLYNKLADAKVKKIDLAKITRDRYYDAVTVRIYADGCDYTRTEENGKIVGGSKQERRAYTEYWTFVRSADRKGVVHSDVACPNCGATPIAMSDIGDCTHCNAAIENGSIDWTLSRIEQDDSYAG